MFTTIMLLDIDRYSKMIEWYEKHFLMLIIPQDLHTKTSDSMVWINKKLNL